MSSTLVAWRDETRLRVATRGKKAADQKLHAITKEIIGKCGRKCLQFWSFLSHFGLEITGKCMKMLPNLGRFWSFWSCMPPDFDRFWRDEARLRVATRGRKANEPEAARHYQGDNWQVQQKMLAMLVVFGHFGLAVIGECMEMLPNFGRFWSFWS